MDGHRGRARLVADAVDVAGAALTRVTGTQMECRVALSVDHEVLADAPGGAADADARDVVVVEARALAGHPREHPRVDALVLVDQLVPPPVRVEADERLPDLRAVEDVTRQLLELVGIEEPVARDQVPERHRRRHVARDRCHLGLSDEGGALLTLRAAAGSTAPRAARAARSARRRSGSAPARACRGRAG